jgi:hypothetical protein
MTTPSQRAYILANERDIRLRLQHFLSLQRLPTQGFLLNA